MTSWLSKNVPDLKFLIITDDPSVNDKNKKEGFGLNVMKLKDFLDTYHKVCELP